MLDWIAQNTLMAGGMAAIVWAACTLLRPRPALACVLWALVLVRLVAPPLPAPVRVDVAGAARSGALSAAQYLQDRCEAVFGDPEAAWRHAARKRRVTQAQFGLDREVAEHRPSAANSAPGGTLILQAGRQEPGEGLAPAAPADDLCATTFATMAFAAGPEAGRVSPADAGGISSWRQVAGLVWVIGAGVTGVWLAWRAIGFGRKVRRARPADASLQRAVAAVAGQMRMAPPRVLVSDELSSPVVWAVGRPALVWPGTGCGSVLLQQSSVIAHELAHIRRRDHWLLWGELVLMALLWWNPVMWLARTRMRHSAELACDAWAVGHFPRQRRLYAETLVALCAGSAGVAAARTAPVGAMGLGVSDCSRRNFERRLRLIMSGAKTSGGYRTPRGAAGAIGAAALLAVAPAWSARPSEAPPALTIEVDPAIRPSLRPAVEQSILAHKAQRLFELEAWSRAADAYAQLLELRGPDGEALSRLGAALLMEGRTAEAIEALTAQCDLNYRRDVGEFNLAAAHARAGNVKEAVRHLEAAVRIGFSDVRMLEEDPDLDAVRGRPGFLEVARRAQRIAELRGRALAALGSGTAGEAVELWARVVELTPSDARSIHLLAVAQIRAGALRDAIATYRPLLDSPAFAALASYNTACAAARAGDIELAMNSLHRAVRAGFDDASLLGADSDLDGLRRLEAFVRLEQGLAQRDRLQRDLDGATGRGDWPAAERAARSLLTLDPSSGDTWALLGSALLEQRDACSAAEAFGWQVALGHDVSGGLYSLARALAAQGRSGEAIAHLGMAIEAGFRDGLQVEQDQALASLRAEAEFARVQQSLADASALGKFGAVDWDHLLDRSVQLARRMPQDGRLRLRMGWAHLRLGSYDEAVKAFHEQERLGFAPGIARYNVACALALDGRRAEALRWLEASLEAGFADAAHARADLDLRSLHGLAGFEAYLQRAGEISGGQRMIY